MATNERTSMDEQLQRDLRTDLAKEQTVMASERTFLSWLRTGLAIVGGGIVIVRFIVLDDPFEHMLLLIAGKMLILWGMLIFGLSFVNFRRQCTEKNAKLSLAANIVIASLVISLIFIALVLFIFIR
ncbi:MAG: DUF202 domain-containing protein [Verrucomicrobia bacterium]|nr:DUF202 domain-containing protein [Verrucomicrobiota bacterium]MBS0636463.1 DUF202 domain-containing protein [Verrucomicrobiota bacterium]